MRMRISLSGSHFAEVFPEFIDVDVQCLLGFEVMKRFKLMLYFGEDSVQRTCDM